MSDFSEAIPVILHNEGSAYVPDDNGRGPSKFGITLETYREYFPKATAEDILNLGPEQATAFYRIAVWERFHIGLLDSQGVAGKVLDLVVNCGPIALKWLQRSVDSCEDGILGIQTATAVNTSPPNQVLANLRANASNYYNVLALKDPTKYAADLPGWLARLAQS
jgi:lysozyme family protein